MKAFWAAENWLRLRILSVALIVLLPAVGVAYLNVEAAREDQFRLVEQETLSSARLLAAQQATLIAATRQTLRMLASSEHVLAGEGAECDAEMRRVMASLAHYANVGFIDADGFVRCSALPLPQEEVYLGDRDYFRAAMETGRFARSTYQVERVTGIPSQTFGHPVRDASGSIVGVVAAAMDLRALHRLAESSQVESGTVFLFLDRTGRVLAAPDQSGLEPGESVDGGELERQLNATSEGHARATIGGERMLVSFTELDGMDQDEGAFVLVATPVARIQAQAQDAFWGSAIVLAIAAIIGIGAALFLAERVIVREQTERRRERSARIEALQEADRQHVVMVNEIGHDLSSPLSPIKMQLYLLRRSPDPLTEKQEKALQIVERNVAHMARLVDDLRDVFKLEAGKFVIEPVPFDLSRQLEEVRDSFQQVAEERELEIAVETAPDLEVIADRDRVNQAIFNLVSNAIKFSPEGGRVELAGRAQDSMAFVAVTDEGPGLTEEEIEQLFQPFSQVGGERRSEDKGTGLGLYISKNIIEQHGGETGVKSAGHGRGSTFWFTLPLRAGARSAPQAARGSRNGGRRRS